MNSLQVKIKEQVKAYRIIIGEGVLSEIVQSIEHDNYSKLAIITDTNVNEHWAENLEEVLRENINKKIVKIVIKAGEKNKNLKNLEKIWKKLYKERLDRKSLIINLGGGMIGDLGGFAASTYMKGIDFLQIPTTLLSQVDASIGGKTAIDFSGGKNIIGAFSQPIGVIIDINTLATLPARELTSGFAEIIKHGLIADTDYLQLINDYFALGKDQDTLEEIIKISCQIKQKVVEEDEKEGGVRKILNFGHTIGHAIESLSLKTKSPLLHGEAVAIGLIAEAKQSQLNDTLSPKGFNYIEEIIKQAGLPTKYNSRNGNYQNIYKEMLNDKKNSNNKIKWVLLDKLGDATWDNEITDKSLIKQAINYVIK